MTIPTLPQETIDRINHYSWKEFPYTHGYGNEADANESYRNVLEDSLLKEAERALPLIEALKHIYECYADEWTYHNREIVETAMRNYNKT